MDDVPDYALPNTRRETRVKYGSWTIETSQPHTGGTSKGYLPVRSSIQDELARLHLGRGDRQGWYDFDSATDELDKHDDVYLSARELAYKRIRLVQDIVRRELARPGGLPIVAKDAQTDQDELKSKWTNFIIEQMDLRRHEIE